MKSEAKAGGQIMRHGFALMVVVMLSWPVSVSGQGWYLLEPRDAEMVTSRKPLREWVQLGAFDSADACEQFRDRYLKTVLRESLKGQLSSDSMGLAAHSRCIAGDDARLR